MISWSCSNNVAQEQPKSIKLDLTIFDESNNLVQGANIYLLSNASDFDQSTALEKAVNPVDETISDGNGKATINLEKDKNYFLFIIKNTSGVIRTNIENNISNLPKNLNISVNIRLKPTNGSIRFLSLNPEINSKNLQVSISGISISQKSTLVINNPTGNVFVSRYGKYKYQATDAEGCSWTGFFELFRGEALAKDEILENCNFGKVEFLTDNISSNLPLNLSIDGVNFGQITANSTNTFSLLEGNHTYFAKSTSPTNDCVWASTFDVSSNSTFKVLLPECK